jgi:hypothetical protein
MSDLADLTAQLESLWGNLDELLGGMEPSDWDRRHGKLWTFRDVPFHLAYFDREMIADPITSGSAVPSDEQTVFTTLGELDTWNDQHFAERPAGLSVDAALAPMRDARQSVRNAISGLEDEQLADAAFSPLPGSGWIDIAGVLMLAQLHTWNHFVEAKIRLRRPGPQPDPAVVHNAIHATISAMPMALNTALAQEPFVAQMTVGGPGGGEWTITVNGRRCRVDPAGTDNADITMVFRDAEAFAASTLKITNPMLLMLTRRLSVKGKRNMSRFAKLFPTPRSDTPLM